MNTNDSIHLTWMKNFPVECGWYWWRQTVCPNELFVVQVVKDSSTEEPLYIDGGNGVICAKEDFCKVLDITDEIEFWPIRIQEPPVT